MYSWHIHIEGQVQGVGFRPYVYLLANKYDLPGWVLNAGDGVHIEFNATSETADSFYHQLIEEAPELSVITNHSIKQVNYQDFNNFSILHSQKRGDKNLLLTPDFALCQDCRTELYEQGNRREGYPFITCTNCGPRYSIVKKLPYDRINTTMNSFSMCSDCQREYDNPSDRRYYSQTNSCPECGISLAFKNGKGNLLSGSNPEILASVVNSWSNAGIVAIKGIGGYLLTCDAQNPSVIQKLRERKYRPSKPFALMFPGHFDLKEWFNVTRDELELLNSNVAPIVLLKLNAKKRDELAVDQIAPGLNELGIMLPYAPLFHLLLSKFGKPIIATSGNLSNAPIQFKDKEAQEELSKVADFILSHNRQIVIPQDDSVIRFSSESKQRILLRRSRGLSPTLVLKNSNFPHRTVLATGAMLKSTFSLLHHQNTYISQYFGDLSGYGTYQHYQWSLHHFLSLFDAKPDQILVDKHPDYPSTQLGITLAKDKNLPVVSIQHHLAHFGAILGEHELVDSKESILGIIWDGTGLGNDGHIWGGEFFNYQDYQFDRVAHLPYFSFLLGDKMPREPRISALALCSGLDGAKAILKEKFSPTEWKIYQSILEKGTALQTSSVGRIFDAIASLLGVKDIQSYEGEAAARLEALAQSYFTENKKQSEPAQWELSYLSHKAPWSDFLFKSIMDQVVLDICAGSPVKLIAAKFHVSLVHLIQKLAKQQGVKHLAFSGGVFQNSLLVDLLIAHLGSDFHLLFHDQLSPNDENISFGQIICHQIQLKRAAIIQSKSNDYVFSNTR